MRQLSKPNLGGTLADILLLGCAITALIAFFFLPWLRVSGQSFTAAALFYEPRTEVLDIIKAHLLKTDFPSLFLILVSGITGAALALRRILNPQARQGMALDTLFAGAVGLAYFVIFAGQNQAIPETQSLIGSGFWVVLIAVIGMVLQVFVPRPNAVSARRRWRTLRHEIQKNRWAYVFISPFYILFLIFGFFPVLFSVYLSLQDWNGVRPMQYVGLQNFEHIFGPGGRAFRQSIMNGVYLFFMYVPIMTFMAIVLAVILNSQRIRGFRFYRTLFFAPYVTSMIAAGFTFRLILTNDGGLANIILHTAGLPGVPWLENQWWARVSLCLLVIWGWLGYNMVLMLAGLQTIPRELAEAARVDGASHTQTLFYITIPLLRPMILFSVVLSTMGTFGLFNEVMALTGGGPARATLTPMVYIYGLAFGNQQQFRFGRASAYGYVYFFLIFMLTIFQFKFVGREEK